ncbi:hypothetical protein RB594_004898 [Gaeumannomyces avenae]
MEPADLWKSGVEEYNKRRTNKLKIKAKDMASLVQDQKEQTKKFEDWRHDKGRLDRVRTALGSACGAVNVAVGPVGDMLSNVYPPASTIGQALSFVLMGCEKVSEKLDKIETFYETVKFFFERLSLLESRMPQQVAFQKPLTRVFLAILEIIRCTESYIKGGRLRAFGSGLFGADGGLDVAYAQYGTRMSELESSVIMATLGTVTAIGGELEGLGGVALMISNRLGDLQSARAGSQLAGGARPNASPEQRMLAGGGGEHLWAESGADSASRNFRALGSVLRWISGVPRVSPRQRLLEMERSLVPGTCAWVDGNEHLKGLLESGECRRVRIVGPPGTGKSMLAFHIFRLLRNELYARHGATPPFSVVYLRPEDDYGNKWSLGDMLASCAIQIAEEDEAFRSEILNKSVGGAIDLQLLKEIIFDKRAVYLVVDGVRRESKILEELKTLHEHFLRTRFVLVMQETFNEGGGSLPLGEDAKINSQEGSKQDLRLFAKARLHGFLNLQRRTEKRKDDIVRLVCEKADSFFYVHEALRLCNEKQGLLKISDMPADTEDLRKKICMEALEKLSPRHHQQLQCVVSWLAWSRRPITLGAAKRLVDLVSKWRDELPGEAKDVINLKREINHSLSGLLTLTANDHEEHE